MKNRHKWYGIAVIGTVLWINACGDDGNDNNGQTNGGENLVTEAECRADKDNDGNPDCSKAGCEDFVFCQNASDECKYQNGKPDCTKAACANKPECKSGGNAENTDAACKDQTDNDGDNLIDCDDPDCAAFCVTDENSEATCHDEIDNDGDGNTDCEDTDCEDFCHDCPVNTRWSKGFETCATILDDAHFRMIGKPEFDAYLSENNLTKETLILTVDVDLGDGSSPWYGMGLDPATAASGNAAPISELHLDGGGHTLSGTLKCPDTQTECGLFHALEQSDIRNLTLDLKVSGNQEVGALAAVSSKSKYSHITSRSEVKTSTMDCNTKQRDSVTVVGGLLGSSFADEISDVEITGTTIVDGCYTVNATEAYSVTGLHYAYLLAGGLAGKLHDPMVSNVTVGGSVSSEPNYDQTSGNGYYMASAVGGLAGHISSRANISRVTIHANVESKVSGKSSSVIKDMMEENTGGLAGMIESTDRSIVHRFPLAGISEWPSLQKVALSHVFEDINVDGQINHVAGYTGDNKMDSVSHVGGIAGMIRLGETGTASIDVRDIHVKSDIHCNNDVLSDNNDSPLTLDCHIGGIAGHAERVDLGSANYTGALYTTGNQQLFNNNYIGGLIGSASHESILNSSANVHIHAGGDRNSELNPLFYNSVGGLLGGNFEYGDFSSTFKIVSNYVVMAFTDESNARVNSSVGIVAGDISGIYDESSIHNLYYSSSEIHFIGTPGVEAAEDAAGFDSYSIGDDANHTTHEVALLDLLNQNIQNLDALKNAVCTYLNWVQDSSGWPEIDPAADVSCK